MCNTNEDPPAQLKSQPVAEEETQNNGISLDVHIILMLQPAFVQLMLKTFAFQMALDSAKHRQQLTCSHFTV